MNLSRILEFNKLLITFREVERQVMVAKKDQKENDAEHSYQLAMLGWYISSGIPELDSGLVIKYALVHDLVEAYAGDTDVFSKDPEAHASKKDREEEAAKRIKEEFPEFSELHKLIEEYERKENAESRFVYALDKLLPALNIYQDGGRTWQQRGISFEMVVEEKKCKMAVSPEVTAYFDEFVSLIEREKDRLW